MTVKLAFRPSTHRFHFRNPFHSNVAGGVPEVRFDGLCGGMVLGAFNYSRGHPLRGLARGVSVGREARPLAQRFLRYVAPLRPRVRDTRPAGEMR